MQELTIDDPAALAILAADMPEGELAALCGRLAVSDAVARNYPGDLAAGDASAFPWRMIVEAVAACPGDLAAAAEWVGLGLTASDLEAQKIYDDERGLALAAVAELRRRADAARPDLAALRRGESVSGKWEPFPLDQLPAGLRGYVRAQAEAVGVDPAAIALPCLVALGGAVGTSRIVELKGGYSMPLSLWGALVCRSGTKKTPAIRAATWPIRARQAALAGGWKEQVKEWERAEAKGRGDKPRMPQIMLGDATPEAAAHVLNDNPRGALLVRDELSGWLDMSRYASGTGGAAEGFWLSLYDGLIDPVNRRGGGDPVYVDRAAVSIIGGIQPGVFRRDLGERQTENGLLARLLVCNPPESADVWTDAEPPLEALRYYGGLCDSLLDLQDNGGQAVVMQIAEEARELWRQEHNSFAGLLAKTRDDRLRAHYSKLLGVAGRAAALLELVEQTAVPVVSAESVARAWRLVRWFAAEAARVYGVTFGGDDMGRRIVEFVRKNSGCAPSALSGGGVRNLTKAARDDVLPDLIDAGLLVRRGRALYALTVEGCGLN